jgi:hypothetical protein
VVIGRARFDAPWLIYLCAAKAEMSEGGRADVRIHGTKRLLPYRPLAGTLVGTGRADLRGARLESRRLRPGRWPLGVDRQLARDTTKDIKTKETKGRKRRIQEALDLNELDPDRRRGSVLVRRGEGGRRREVGMDDWGFDQLDPG